MLSRDGLARSAHGLPTCLICLPACFLTRLLRCHEMVWLGQLFVSPLVSICLPTCCCHKTVWLSQLLVSPPVSSLACWAGGCHQLVWLGQPFVFRLVSICLPTCFLTHSRAGLGAVTRWSGSVSSLSPHLFAHSLAGVDAVARWSGSVSPLSPHLFAFVSPLVSSRACCCHELVWLCLLFVPVCFHSSPHLLSHSLTGLDAVTRWSGSASPLSPLVCICLPTCFLTRLLGSRDGLARSALCLPACFILSPHSLSPHLFPFVSPFVSSCACWAGRCHEMVWLGHPFVSPLVSSRACWAGCCHKMVWLSQLFVSPCFLLSPHLFPHALAGLDAVTRWSDSAAGCCCGCCCRVQLQGGTQTCPGAVARCCCRQAAGHVARCCRRPGLCWVLLVLWQGAAAIPDSELRSVVAAAGHVARCCRRPGLRQGAVAGRDPELRRVLLLGAVGAVAGCCCNPRLRVAQGAVARCCWQGAAAGRGSRVVQGAVAGLRRAQGAAARCVECCCVPRLRVAQGAAAGQVARGPVATVRTSAD